MVRRHLEAVNDALKLQQDIMEWQQKGMSFLDSYWRFSDPEGNQTKAYNEQILKQWKLASAENVELCDRVIEWISADEPIELKWKFY